MVALIRRPRRKKLTKMQRQILEKFRTPTVERRDPRPKTIGDFVTNGLLRQVGLDDESFPLFEMTEVGLEALTESEDE